MKKIIAGFLALTIPFFVLWYLFSLINWEDKIYNDDRTSKLEKSLGDLYVEAIGYTEETIKGSDANVMIDSIVSRLCGANDIERGKIKTHLLKSSQVNAFALPDNNMAIYTGLIDYCQTPEELAGVIAHELAHMQKGHIMKKLTREIGFVALTGMITSGNIGPEVVRMLGSTAYDRTMETEADDTAVQYMLGSGISPAHFSDFMFRLSLEENELLRHLSFISTHPESEKRAYRIMEMAVDSDIEFSEIIPPAQWEEIKRSLKDE